MKFGFRKPSIKKRISARTSWKRAVRHRMKLKAPRGMGVFTNPKKVIYNRIYRRTTFGIEDLPKLNTKATVEENGFTNLGSIGEEITIGKILGFCVVGLVFTFILPVGFIGIPILLFSAYMFFIFLRMKISPQYKSQVKLKDVEKLLRKNFLSEAVELLNEVISLDPDNANAVFILAGVLHNSGRQKEAISYFEKYLSFYPTDLEAKLGLANSYYTNKEYGRAIEIAQSIPEEYPKYLKAIQIVALSFAEQNKYDLAIETFRKAPLRKRKLDENLMELHYNLAVTYEKAGNKKNALKHYKRVFLEDVTYRDIQKVIQNLEEEIKTIEM